MAINKDIGYRINFNLILKVVTPKELVDQELKASSGKKSILRQIREAFYSKYLANCGAGCYLAYKNPPEIWLNERFIERLPKRDLICLLYHELIHHAQHQLYHCYFRELSRLSNEDRRLRMIKAPNARRLRSQLNQIMAGRISWLEGHAEYLSDLMYRRLNTQNRRKKKINFFRIMPELMILANRFFLALAFRREVKQGQIARAVIKRLTRAYPNLLNIMFTNPAFVDVLFQQQGVITVQAPKGFTVEATKKLVLDLIRYRADKGRAFFKRKLRILIQS